MSEESELDFETIKEPWNKYELRDSTYLKSRHILMKVKKKGNTYGIEGQNITVTYNVPKNLKGTPSTQTYTPEELSSSIVVDEVGYNTILEEWNEYIVDDGARIRIKDTIISVSRTSKYDRNGDPIYVAQHSTLVQVRPRKES